MMCWGWKQENISEVLSFQLKSLYTSHKNLISVKYELKRLQIGAEATVKDERA